MRPIFEYISVLLDPCDCHMIKQAQRKFLRFASFLPIKTILRMTTRLLLLPA
ncbi:hypothetical protein FWK35_00031660 [Aphis craccivora]|uniref:Uncharacterized protein n=1 Tax=Aphis craccivora TaxID=307492 RepID=A0A6G0YVT6_APHCR|nr:hypothetical protein FWK35_00031660 [Aphis craccivora]